MAGYCKNESNMFNNLNIHDPLSTVNCSWRTLCHGVNHICEVPFVKAHMSERSSMSMFFRVVRINLMILYKPFNKVVSLLHWRWSE
jgi:hypothetical protein